MKSAEDRPSGKLAVQLNRPIGWRILIQRQMRRGTPLRWPAFSGPCPSIQDSIYPQTKGREQHTSPDTVFVDLEGLMPIT